MWQKFTSFILMNRMPILGLALMIAMILIIPIPPVQEHGGDTPQRSESTSTIMMPPPMPIIGADTSVVTAATMSVSRPVKRLVPPASMHYQNALMTYASEYGNGYRIQFNDCSGIAPARMTMKVGTKFMIDNRDDLPHRFMYGGTQAMLIPAYDFYILQAEGPGEQWITCDGQGAGLITVQP